MTSIISGSAPSITFSDNTTQSTAGLPLTGGTVTGNVTTSGLIIGTTALGAGNATRFKNRIINGDMRIDQRNAGSATTASNNYPVDRFNATFTDGTITRQQSTTAPVGFSNSLSLTVTSSSSGSSSTRSIIEQRIEGFNVADLGFGTVNAKTFTVSFWCRSSIAGSYSGSITDTSTRSYPFSFTISATNTWEQKSVTITADASGSNWSTTNGTGMALRICLGSGSSFLGTANAWSAGNLDGVTGTTNWIATAGATFYITGVQLEVGSIATGFEYVDYGTQLVMCQRYYEKSYDMPYAQGSATNNGIFVENVSNCFAPRWVTQFQVRKRTDPSVRYWDTNGTENQWQYWNNGSTGTFGWSNQSLYENCMNIELNSNITFSVRANAYGHWAASAEL